jgi:WD40 repeat protein/tetratricopeptide (TPR) repeat protein
VRSLSVGGPPGSIALDPDDALLAVYSRGVTVRRFKTGDVVASWLPPANLFGLAWHPRRDYLAGAGADRRVYLWEPWSGGQRAALEGHENAAVRVMFNRAGTLLASWGKDGMTRLWDPRSGKELVRALGMCLEFGPDDRSLAYRGEEELGIWEVAHERVCRAFAAHASIVNHMEFSRDGQMLASSGYDGVRLWDVGATRPLELLPLGRTAGAVFAAGGDSLVTSGDLGLYRWPLRPAAGEPGRHLHLGSPRPLPLPVSARLESPSLDRHGQRLGVPDHGHKGIVLDLDDPTRQMLLVGHEGMNSLAVSPDGRWAATSGTHECAEVKVWDLSARDRPQCVHTIPRGRARAAFSPDGRWLVVADNARTFWYRVGSWELGREAGGRGGIPAFSAGASLIAEYVTASRSVMLSDSETGCERGTLTADDTPVVVTLALSGGGDRLAAATSAGWVQLWDLRAVRRDLAEMGLDWDPALGPPGPRSGRPLRLTTDLDLRQFARLAAALAPRRQLDNALEQLDRELEAARGKDGEAELRFRRGMLRARLARWEQAADDLAHAVQLNPDNHTSRYHLAGVLLWLGDRDGYKLQCEEMLRSFGRTTDPFVAERTAKACLIVPGTVADREHLVRLTEQAVAATELVRANAWFLQTRGLAECRAGRPGQAVKWIEMGRKQFGSEPALYGALAQLFLTLAYHQMNEGDRARQTLSEAVRIIDSKLSKEGSGDPGDGWLDWVFCQVVRREAEGLLARRK